MAILEIIIMRVAKILHFSTWIRNLCLCGLSLMLSGCGWVAIRNITVRTSPVRSVPARVGADPQAAQFVEAVRYVDSVFEKRGMGLTRGDYQPALPKRKMYQCYQRIASLDCTIVIRPESGLICLDIYSQRPFFEFDGTPEFQGECHQIFTNLVEHFGSENVESD